MPAATEVPYFDRLIAAWLHRFGSQVVTITDLLGYEPTATLLGNLVAPERILRWLLLHTDRALPITDDSVVLKHAPDGCGWQLTHRPYLTATKSASKLLPQPFEVSV